MPVTVGFNSSSLRQMMSLNYDGMNVLEDLLKNITLTKTGLTPRQYLTKLVQSLLFPYREVARSSPKARRVARILQRISVVIPLICSRGLVERALSLGCGVTLRRDSLRGADNLSASPKGFGRHRKNSCLLCSLGGRRASHTLGSEHPTRSIAT